MENIIKPYKIKHKPTGLYWQPIKSKGSHFSKRGKTNILNMGFYSDGSPRKTIDEDTLIYKEWKDKLVWEEGSDYKNYKTETKAEDWIIEEI